MVSGAVIVRRFEDRDDEALRCAMGSQASGFIQGFSWVVCLYVGGLDGRSLGSVGGIGPVRTAL